MASATTRPTFSFHLSSSSSPPKPTPNLPFQPLLLTTKTHYSISSTTRNLNILTAKSVDVSKEDKPISEQAPDNPETPPTTTDDDYNSLTQQKELSFEERRRLEEKFAVLNTGVYECKSCGYLYDEKAGDPAYPVPPGMQFGKLPEDWRCPTCGAAKSFFESKSIEIAGFAQNQQFGLGGNTLTSGQKAVLIYGGLLLGFALFLSGYFLQ